MAEVPIFIGLLTHQQKQAGYFVMQDAPLEPDFVWLMHRRNGNPACIANWPYADLTIKTVRDTARAHLEGSFYDQTKS